MNALDIPIIVNPELVGTDMDGDYVMLDIERGEYYGLAEVARFIWDLLQQGPHSAAQLIEAVCESYDVERSVCESDVMSFIAELRDRQLLS